jgi:hypothetical protein
MFLPGESGRRQSELLLQHEDKQENTAAHHGRKQQDIGAQSVSEAAAQLGASRRFVSGASKKFVPDANDGKHHAREDLRHWLCEIWDHDCRAQPHIVPRGHVPEVAAVVAYAEEAHGHAEIETVVTVVQDSDVEQRVQNRPEQRTLGERACCAEYMPPQSDRMATVARSSSPWLGPASIVPRLIRRDETQFEVG